MCANATAYWLVGSLNMGRHMYQAHSAHAAKQVTHDNATLLLCTIQAYQTGSLKEELERAMME